MPVYEIDGLAGYGISEVFLFLNGLAAPHDRVVGIVVGLVAQVSRVDHLAESPYLKEFYGSISSYVRSIFSGYIGWFSGNITELHPLESKLKAEKIAAE